MNRKSTVVLQNIDSTYQNAIKSIFDKCCAGTENLVKTDSDVFIKYNGVHFGKLTHTNPALLSALIHHFKQYTKETVYCIENTTQGNFTRMVAVITGIEKAVKKAGGKNIYLDEQKKVTVELGADKRKTKFPRILYEKLIENKGNNVLIDVPILKTHIMTTVTLGIKNFQGLLYDSDKLVNHDQKLHQKLVDTLHFIKPDFTLIDAEYGLKHGHFIASPLVDECTVPIGLFIGSTDVVAADTVACKLMGFDVDEVQHVKLAGEQGLGTSHLKNIEIVGELPNVPRFPLEPCRPIPPGIKLIKGQEKACIEGCYGNTLTGLIFYAYQYNKHDREFTVITGKGLPEKELEHLEGNILAVGNCAIQELEEKGVDLERISSKNRIEKIPFCNNVGLLTTSLCRLMGIRAIEMVPINPLKAAWTVLMARIHGLDASIPPIFSK
ncbi:MAG: DUF362 domain-containing protein [Candidatus Odinarchaeota archaeon]